MGDTLWTKPGSLSEKEKENRNFSVYSEKCSMKELSLTGPVNEIFKQIVLRLIKGLFSEFVRQNKIFFKEFFMIIFLFTPVCKY